MKYARTCISRYGLNISFSRESDIEIVDGYVGLGYAQSRPEELSLLMELASTEGLFLDPVYTGKAFFGMMQELRRNPKIFGDRIVFLHTGGIFGLLAKANEFSPTPSVNQNPRISHHGLRCIRRV